VNDVISGSAVTMLGDPPKSLCLLSMSPNVLETSSQKEVTDKPPGFTLQGPKTLSSDSSGIRSI
jgi:hypothetical protein